jgi:hypothetical protein
VKQSGVSSVDGALRGLESGAGSLGSEVMRFVFYVLSA